MPAQMSKALLGYNWAFDSPLAEAQSSAASYMDCGHEHFDNARTHLRLAQNARPSDYPVLFYLARILPPCRVATLAIS